MDFGREAAIPIFDIGGARSRGRGKMVAEVREALETWGLFQVVNHGISLSLLDKVMKETRKFHEDGSKEAKQALYPDDPASKIRYRSNFERHLMRPSWKNTLSIQIGKEFPTPQEFSSPYRDTLLAYVNHAKKLGETLMALVSEAFGLEPDRLKKIGCLEGMRVACHLYPPTPHPDLTVGILPHSDPSFLTLLLQGQVGGLQILHNHNWLHVPPVHGAILVNVGDLLQLITNGILRSVVHRVAVNQTKPRISVACLINGSCSKVRLGPMKELIHDGNPAQYRETTAPEYLVHFSSKLADFTMGLAHLEL